MGAFDVFGQIDTIRPSQFEHASEWLTFQHVDISSTSTACAFSGIIAFSSTPNDPSPNVLLVAGQITLGSSGILHVGTAYNISFTASPRSGSHQGIRQYQGSIKPIEPLGATPRSSATTFSQARIR